jgi:hypothetical protein
MPSPCARVGAACRANAMGIPMSPRSRAPVRAARHTGTIGNLTFRMVSNPPEFPEQQT